MTNTPLTITHPFVSSKADGDDTSVVRPSDWNAEHTLNVPGDGTVFLDGNGNFNLPPGVVTISPYLTDGNNYYLPLTYQMASPPQATNFTWKNQGSGGGAAGEVTVGSSPALMLSCNGMGSNTSVHMRSQNIGDTATLNTCLLCVPSPDVWHESSCGIGLLQSSTGKLVTFGLAMTGFNSQTSTPGSYQIVVRKYTDQNTASTTSASLAPLGGSLLFLTINITPSTYQLIYSHDGISTQLGFQCPHSEFFSSGSADQLFYFVNNEGGSGICYATVLSWEGVPGIF